MKLLRNTSRIPDFTKGSVVTAGNFDGVHLGHQALLTQLKNTAQLLNMTCCVLLFEPQPSEFFHHDKAAARLSSLREKIRLMAQFGIDYVFCLKFDEKLSKMDAIDFAEQYLFDTLNSKHILIGADFRFGRDRKGDVSLLTELAKKHQCDMSIFPDFIFEDQRVSSTNIRSALMHGNLNQASLMLGRFYGFCARVVQGAGLGRQWGIPTANIQLHGKKFPLKGVFCVQVYHEKRILNAVANIGTRPTVDGSKTVLEVHILDYEGTLYGSWLNIYFVHKLRDEIRFDSVDKLINQIHIDIEKTREFFRDIFFNK